MTLLFRVDYNLEASFFVLKSWLFLFTGIFCQQEHTTQQLIKGKMK